MGLENALRFLLLIAPYIPRLKYGLGAVLQGSPFAPGEITQAFALLTGREVEWIARHATAKELIEATPILDEVNDFRGLWAAAKALGLITQ